MSVSKQIKLSYSKDDLTEFLKRHSAQNKECECECSFTGNSLEMLIQFVGIENDLPEIVIDKAMELAKFLMKQACITGSRLVSAGAIYYIASFSADRKTCESFDERVNSEHDYRFRIFNQSFFANLLFVSSLSIRQRYKFFLNSFREEIIEMIVEGD